MGPNKMVSRTTLGITRLALCASISAVLAACGGGGGNSTPQGSQQAATSISGTVAVGTALAGATVTVIDVNGKTATGTSTGNGSYSVSVQGLTAPFLLEAADPSGASTLLYSVVANANTPDGAPLIANVTPLTSAVSALLTQSGDPGTLAQSGGLSSVTTTSLGNAETTLGKLIAPILSANGLSAASFDPVGTAFTPNQTGLDAVIDSITVSPSVRGAGLQITSLAAPNSPIDLNSATAASTTLAAPAQPANYLSSLVSTLGQCVSDVQGGATATSDAACAAAIDASYLNDGAGSGIAGFAKRHSLFTKGTALTGVKTLTFLPAGTLPGVSNPAALVYFLMTDPNGKPDFASDIVQQLPNGSWDIVGNQDQFDLYIASFVGRLQYVDQANAANSRYESGLRIQIPSLLNVPASLVTADGAISLAAAGDAIAQVGSAVVTGPGLPPSGVGLYLDGSARTASNGSAPLLTFPSVASTAPFTCPGGSTPAPCTMSDGTSSEYKWAWSPLSGTSSVNVPSTSDYASQSADTSTIPQFGAYTVTLYAVDGSQIGTPQTVINVAPIQAPQTGQQVAWQTLGSDVISSFLTPGGSAAGAGVTSLSLDWTEPALNPLTPTSIITGESTQAPDTTAVLGYASYLSPTVTRSGTGYSSTVTLKNPTGSPLSGDVSRLVSLLEQVGGDYYINTWRYQ